ncbi:MAG: porin family protein [Ginsengibacter sp.]
MKKQILLILSVLISTFTFAQLTPAFGVRAGVTSAGVRGDAADNLNKLLDFTGGLIKPKNSTGFFAGVYASLPLTGNISVEPALYYSQKGYELNGGLNLKGVEFLGASAKAKLQLQYIDVPVLLKANFGGMQLFAGPQISYLTRADLRTTAGVLGINLLSKTTDATAQFNPWDVAVTGGIGYQLTNGVNIMASYDYGLSKMDANKNVSSYNHAVKIGLGISF